MRLPWPFRALVLLNPHPTGSWTHDIDYLLPIILCSDLGSCLIVVLSPYFLVNLLKAFYIQETYLENSVWWHALFYTVPCKYINMYFRILWVHYSRVIWTLLIWWHVPVILDGGDRGVGSSRRGVGSSRCSLVTYWVWEKPRVYRTLSQTSKQNSIERRRDGPFTYQKIRFQILNRVYLESVKVWETPWWESVQPGCPVLYV